MLNKRKILAGFVHLGLFFSIVTGCGSNDGRIINHSDTKEVTVTILFDSQIEQDGIRAVAANIEKKYNIKTEIETRPSGVEGHEVIKTRLATGDMTDLVFYNSGSLVQDLNPEEYFVDLKNEPFMKDVLEPFKKSVMVNGKVFGAPVGNAFAGGWLYNKKVYKELGLSIPKTWNELMANSEKIKGAGKTAVIGTYKEEWTSQLIVLADNHNVIAEYPTFAEDLTAHKVDIATTPTALRSFEKLSEVYLKGYLNSDFQSSSINDGLKMLAEGTGVQYPYMSKGLMEIAKQYPNQMNDIGFFPQPGDNPESNGLTMFMPAAIYVNENTQNLEAAKKWVEYFISPEGVKIYQAKQIPIGPFALKGLNVPDHVMPAVKDILTYFESEEITPALEYLIPLKGPDLPQITAKVGSGTITAKQGAQLYDQDLEKQAKQIGLKGW
ncbi:carbohydrate ABC transporter substrate-binding protein [Bacillus sp. EB106-08-02-XG196]|uniref:ABC transporter substrate-binding protein n=1 Tax=Bacillus sp. EB106-08-02-XG196 TaxID=2737049 RepID=UPI0015C44618|nr:ABC transporter substrate-binding protein [Bacillus sp. EB106-08-02-XG196]NWQ41707.1 carbohydrate ABC transporter substrate-binding protein [Bacillus sp. EB106-08-02-XG196]